MHNFSIKRSTVEEPLWLHDLYLEALTMYGNELNQFLNQGFSHNLTIFFRLADISGVCTIFSVHSYDLDPNQAKPNHWYKKNSSVILTLIFQMSNYFWKFWNILVLFFCMKLPFSPQIQKGIQGWDSGR